jgi:hypothetical protein
MLQISSVLSVAAIIISLTGLIISVLSYRNSNWKLRSDVLSAILDHIGTDEIRDIRHKLHSMHGLSEEEQRRLYHGGAISKNGITLKDGEIRKLIVGYDRLAYQLGDRPKYLDEACMVQIDTVPFIAKNLNFFLDALRNDSDRRQPNYAHDLPTLFQHFDKHKVSLERRVRDRLRVPEGAGS